MHRVAIAEHEEPHFGDAPRPETHPDVVYGTIDVFETRREHGNQRERRNSLP
jgi:hypothetical protein